MELGNVLRDLGELNNQNLSDLIKAKEYYNIALPILQKELGPESYVVEKNTHGAGKSA